MNFSEAKHRMRMQRRWRVDGTNRSARKTQHPRQSCRQIYLCPKCNRPFKWRYNLQHHLKFACGQSPRFNCPYCAFRTKHTSNVRAHVRRKHPNSEVYVIDILAWQQCNAAPAWIATVLYRCLFLKRLRPRVASCSKWRFIRIRIPPHMLLVYILILLLRLDIYQHVPIVSHRNM